MKMEKQLEQAQRIILLTMSVMLLQLNTGSIGTESLCMMIEAI